MAVLDLFSGTAASCARRARRSAIVRQDGQAILSSTPRPLPVGILNDAPFCPVRTRRSEAGDLVVLAARRRAQPPGSRLAVRVGGRSGMGRFAAGSRRRNWWRKAVARRSRRARRRCDSRWCCAVDRAAASPQWTRSQSWPGHLDLNRENAPVGNLSYSAFKTASAWSSILEILCAEPHGAARFPRQCVCSVNSDSSLIFWLRIGRSTIGDMLLV